MLQDLGTIYTGSTPKTNDESLFGGDIPFVTPGDLGEITPIHTATRSLTEEGAKTGTLLPEGAVLVCCIGSLGKIGFAGRPLVTNQQINAIVFDGKKIDPRYGFFACRLLKPQLESMAPATTVPIVNKSRFSELKIPVPPLEEQRRIAAILDQAETLRTQRRTALALQGSLSQSLFLDMFGDPVANPKGWPTPKFGEVGTLDRGISKHRPRNAPELLGGKHPLVQTGEVANCDGYIRSYTNTYSDLGLRQSKLWPAGTLCITIAANIAKTGILTFDACFPDSVVGFRADDPATVEYVRVWLSFLQKALEDSAPESAQKNINLAILRGLNIPLPPLPLQQTFATRIASIEALKATHRRALAALDALFASLQQRAFAGAL
jgi:type I restriction enzyme S subunit